MDDHRSADALTDELDRDLEAALAVDPSSGFVTRVRARVQSERDVRWSPFQWRFAPAAVAIVVVAAVVLGMSWPNRSQIAQKGPVAQEAAVAQNASGTQTAPVVPESPVAQDPSTARPEPARPRVDREGVEGRALRAGFSPAPKRAVASPTRRSASRNDPEVIIAAGEARALRRLFADVRNGLIDLSSLQEGAPASAALQPPSDIAFPPITFEPIAVETAEEGERQ
jgi:hypothetical protein